MVVTKLSRGVTLLKSLVTPLHSLVTTCFSRREDDMPDWARRLLAAKQTTDLARDPTDPKVTRQSAATIQGVLVPVSGEDKRKLNELFLDYWITFECYREGHDDAGSLSTITSTMKALLERAAARAERRGDGRGLEFDYISIDPRDYTVYTANHVDIPVVSIHTRPDRCWFLAVLDMDGDIIGMKLGRMKVERMSDQGVYPITIRTNYRALTNKKKQEEVKDAFERLTR